MYQHASRPCTLFWLALAVMAWFGLWLPAQPLTSPDEEMYLRTSLAFLSGTLAVEPLPETFATKQGLDGRQYPQYGPGLSALAVPWISLGRFLTTPTTPNASLQSAETAHPLLRVWISLFNGWVTACSAGILLLWAWQISQCFRTALLVSSAYVLLTTAWPHGRTFFSEPLAGLGMFAALWLLLAYDGSQIKSGIMAGLALAVSILTRIDSLAVAPPLLLLAAIKKPDSFSINQERSEVMVNLPRLVGFIAPLVLALGAMGIYNTVRFGAPLSTGYEDQTEGVKFSTPVLIGLHGFLFSPGRSFFLFSPIFLLIPYGLYRLWKQDTATALGIGVTSGFFLLALSCWQNWAGGWDWGPRHIFQIGLLLAPALAACPWAEWRRRPGKRWGVILLVLWSFAAQSLGVFQDAVETVRPIYANSTNPVFAMQFMVYDPLQSPWAVHWEAMRHAPPNWLWWQLFQQGSPWSWGIVIPLLAFAGSCTVLGRMWVSEAKG